MLPTTVKQGLIDMSLAMVLFLFFSSNKIKSREKPRKAFLDGIKNVFCFFFFNPNENNIGHTI